MATITASQLLEKLNKRIDEHQAAIANNIENAPMLKDSIRRLQFSTNGLRYIVSTGDRELTETERIVLGNNIE